MGIKKIEKFFDENGIEMQKDTYDNGTIVVHGANQPEPQPEPELTQLDRIEERLAALTADSVTVEKLEAAISEGVNDV